MDVKAARTFLLTHARIIERRLAEIYLDGATDVEPVLHALEAYRNADGGFGHGLEGDALAPESQPLAVDTAFGLLDDLADHTGASFADAIATTIPFLRPSRRLTAGCRSCSPRLRRIRARSIGAMAGLRPGSSPRQPVLGHRLEQGKGGESRADLVVFVLCPRPVKVGFEEP